MDVRRLLIQYPAFSSRSGIALVMVLGILSVMVIMAVAFAISMRTERVAAGNYADSVRARQLVQVGLVRALDDLAGKLGTNGLGSAVGGTNYPPWAVTNSYTAAYTNTTADTNLLKLLALNRDNEATNFVPRVLWAAAIAADYTSTATDTNAAHHWLPLDSIITNGSVVESSNRMGRVKYLILNCSGLLDANFAGSMSWIRGAGTNPADIAIWEMPEFFESTPGDGAGGKSFLTRRDDVGAARTYRYETLEELKVLNPLNIFDEYPSDLTVYSYALPGYWTNNTVSNQVNLAGSVADLTVQARKDAIIMAFAHAGFSLPEAGILYSNLIDYVDDDFIPSNLTTCVEAVPMINEVVVSNAIEVSAGSAAANRSYKVITDVYVECWYPFLKGSVASFNLNVTNKFSSVPNIPGFQHPETIANITPLTSASGSAPVKYLLCHLETVPFDLLMVPSITLTTTIDPKVQLIVNVDELKNPIVLTTTHNGDTIARDNQSASFECLDPRFNNDPSDLRQWCPRTILPSDSPIADVNPWTTGWWLTNLAGDVESEMYVADNQLRSVAELGCLVYSLEPWKTVKLYDSDCRRVLDTFAIGTNASYTYVTNTVWRGRVNCNSNPALDATAVVFAEMPTNQYPGEASDGLPMTDAQAFAEKIFKKGVVFTNLSDVGRNLNSADFPAGMNELRRESYFRNAFNLFNLRQNLFTIIIEAHVASGGNIPRNPVRQRAVALVWRDPYTGEMFVRSIKWLRD